MTPTGTQKPMAPCPARIPTTRFRVTDDFLRSVEKDGDWNLVERTTGNIAKTVKSRDLWDQIGSRRLGLRRSGHPVQYNDQ